MTHSRHATLYALAAIVLWGSAALLSVKLANVPPFLLVGAALCIGGVFGLPFVRHWRVPGRTLLLGCAGLFCYHFCLFMALRHAPAVEANLINYLWPLLIVLMAPLLLPNVSLTARHVLGGVLGLSGCAVIIISKGGVRLEASHWLGYAFALAAAFLWSSYSLLTQRVPRFHTGAVGGFCLLSGVMSLLAHAGLEPAYVFKSKEWLYLLLLGIGPLGTAFFFWDAALKQGDARSIGTLAYITPLLSTAMLAIFGGGQLHWTALVALVLILSGACIGNGVLTVRMRKKADVRA